MGVARRKERLEDILIVDCDVHVHESPGELAPYCDMPWRKALENVADVEEYYLDIPGFSPGMTWYEARFPSGHEGRRMVHTAQQMREELSELHVDIGILFPDHLLKLAVITQDDYAAALARAYFPFNLHVFETEFGRHICGHTFSIMANLVHMISSGLPVRFPELRIAVTEVGISWVPFLMNRMDKEYLERRREIPILEERPSHYMKRFYYATQPVEEPENLRDLVTLMSLYDGEDNTVFASDWPHHDFDHPSKVHQIPFSSEVRRKVFGENALKLLKIDGAGRRLNL
jgi:predicted TIM-barrel fold metal-dependent hydrolase